VVLLPAIALTAAFTLGSPSLGPPSGLAPGAVASRGRSDLALRLAVRAPQAASDGLPLGPSAPGAGSPPPVCSGDTCQPAVALPGVQPRYSQSREELVVSYLSRAHVEPLASIVWAFVSTGMHVDYSPPAFDPAGSGVRGWGSVMVRLRLRLDARNEPVFPTRPR
jgi:hypothetical protein